MDLIVLVLVLGLIGLAVWFITTKIQMPPYWASTIQIGALVVLVLYLVSQFGPAIPNILPKR